jgi:hypothetical protein
MRFRGVEGLEKSIVSMVQAYLAHDPYLQRRWQRPLPSSARVMVTVPWPSMASAALVLAMDVGGRRRRVVEKPRVTPTCRRGLHDERLQIDGLPPWFVADHCGRRRPLLEDPLHPADRGGQGPDQVAPEFWIVQIRGRIAR